VSGAVQQIAPLPADLAAQLDRDGYLLLRGAVPPDQCAALQALFDTHVTDAWPVPRGNDWRHAAIDLEPRLQCIGLLPDVLAAAGHILKEPFFFSQIEGREPRPGVGHQTLHRDYQPSGEHVAVLVFLDDYGPANGATRIAPGTHTGREATDNDAITLSGKCGDILVFDAALLHGATRNGLGVRRRSLLGGYAPERLRDTITPTQHLRHVRMDNSQVFGVS
jgi:hypothetical protein